MMIHYVLDGGLPRTCMLQSGHDTVAAFRRALKQLNQKNKYMTLSKEEEIEVYLFGTTQNNYKDSTPMNAQDHLPKGSNSTDRYFFVHLPVQQHLTAEKRSLSPKKPRRRGRSPKAGGGGPSLPGNRARSITPGASGARSKPRGAGGGKKGNSAPPLRKSKTLPPGSITREKLGLGPDSSHNKQKEEEKKRQEEEANKKANEEKERQKRLEAEAAKAKQEAEEKERRRQREEEEAAAARRKREEQEEERKRRSAEAKAKREEEEERRKREAEKEEGARKAAELQCFYQVGGGENTTGNTTGKSSSSPQSINMKRGETVSQLKKRILGNSSGSKLVGVTDAKDLKIYLPETAVAGGSKPGKELIDNDIIPDTSTFEKPLIVKPIQQQCFYKIGTNGKPAATTFVEGDSVKALKNKILETNKGSSIGVKNAQDLKIFLPDSDGNPGKELSDNDSIPDTSSFDKPLIVKRTQQCFYKMGKNGNPNATTFIEGDSVKTLKNKILGNRGSCNSSIGVKNAQDLKIFLPDDRHGKPGKELSDNDTIPDTSSFDKPLIVKRTQQCFYKIGGNNNNNNKTAKTEGTTFLEGDSIKTLKDKILASHRGSSPNVSAPKDLKIYLPDRNGDPGKELSDHDSIPDTSTFDKPLIVKRMQQCFYRLGEIDNNGGQKKPEATTFTEGEPVKALKEKILKSHNGTLGGIQDIKDLKIFVPGRIGQAGKELADNDIIPDNTSLQMPLIVKRTQQCFYKMGNNGTTDTTTFFEGDSVKTLKSKILGTNRGSSIGVKNAQDLKIFLPDKDGKPGKELSDSDTIPDTSSFDKPLIVKRKQQCFYKMGNKKTTDATTFMESDSVKSLKDKILASQRGSNPNAPKEAKDLKIHLPGRNGLPGKELHDDDAIPDTSTFDKPLVVQSKQQCFYQLGNNSGKPDATTFTDGESVKALKEKILESHRGDLGGIKDAKDVKIFLPGGNGQAGKELTDNEKIPDTSSLDMPLIVRKPQKCFYKLGKNGKADASTFIEGDTVGSLKEKILAANRGSSALNGATIAEDLKIFLPTSNGQPGKELSDNESIPNTSSSTIPFLVRACIPVGTSDVFMAFTMPMCKKEPSKTEQEALAATTAEFYRSHLQKTYDNFSDVDVSVSNTVFGKSKPNKNYNLYVEWHIQVWFNKAGAIPDRNQLCKTLVKQIDMMTYLMEHVRSLPEGNSFTGVTGMFTEQVNS